MEEIERDVEEVLDRLGWHVGELTVYRALGGRRTRYQVRRALKSLKNARSEREAQRQEAERVHIQVHAVNAIWSIDATHLGRDACGTAVVAEVVRDVASSKTLGVSIGPPPTSHEVVMLVQRVVKQVGERPLIIASDNGPENRGALEGWCESEHVVQLKNLPRTPQHNPWVEHGNAEIKQHTGLGKGLIARPSDLPGVIQRALDRIDGEIPRATRGWCTAREAYREMPKAGACVDRRAFQAAVACAIKETVEDSCSWRERRLRERKAILQVSQRYELLTTTRGRRRAADAKPDRVS